MLDRSIRELERERQGLQAQEKKLITEIKKTAKEGQMVFYFFEFGIFINWSLLTWLVSDFSAHISLYTTHVVEFFYKPS